MLNGVVAQLVAHWFCIPGVVSSILTNSTCAGLEQAIELVVDIVDNAKQVYEK